MAQCHNWRQQPEQRFWLGDVDAPPIHLDCHCSGRLAILQETVSFGSVLSVLELEILYIAEQLQPMASSLLSLCACADARDHPMLPISNICLWIR